MKIVETRLHGLLLLRPPSFTDPRGSLTELYRSTLSGDTGLPTFVQDNLSHTKRHGLRGLHFQKSVPQAKLLQCLQGEIFDVVVDLRPGSPTFGEWESFTLSSDRPQQLFIPEGFAHGFQVLSSAATVFYKLSALYRPDDQHGILWSDPDLAIPWPSREPLLSKKDRELPLLSELSFRK